MKIAILTSGGDAPGMNVAIRAAVRYALIQGHEIYGVKNGFRGLVNDDFTLLDRKSVSGIISLGGTFLRTARLESFKEKDIQAIAYQNLLKRHIEALIVIGGDGSYRGAEALSHFGIKTIGIPGTIDNDIYGTDYTLGFNTAVSTIVDAIDKIRDTSQSHQRCSIIEVMGRSCGDLALYSGISGGAEFVVTPEHMIEKDVIINRLKKYSLKDRTHAIIVVTENIFDCHALAKEINDSTEFNSRATILGYVQRGGSPVPLDRMLGSKMGTYAIQLLEKGISGVGIGIKNDDIKYDSFNDILSQKRPYNVLYSLIEKIS